MELQKVLAKPLVVGQVHISSELLKVLTELVMDYEILEMLAELLFEALEKVEVFFL